MTLLEDSAVHDLYQALWQSAFVLLYYVMQHAENCKKKKNRSTVLTFLIIKLPEVMGEICSLHEHFFMHAIQTVPEKYNFISPAPPP